MRRVVLFSLLPFLVTPAFAGSQDDINTCQAAVTEAVAEDFSEPVIKFKNIKGASMKTVTFDVTEGEKAATVVCKIKRGDVKSVETK